MGYNSYTGTPIIVTVSNNTFILDSDYENTNTNPTFINGTTYVFDQSDPSNIGNTLIIGTLPDVSSSILSDIIIVGEVGQPGAYTSFIATEDAVYYMSYHNKWFGHIEPYYVETAYNDVGNRVFKIKSPLDSDYKLHNDLSFNSGNVYIFDISHSTMSDVSLVFAEIIDDSDSYNNFVNNTHIDGYTYTILDPDESNRTYSTYYNSELKLSQLSSSSSWSVGNGYNSSTTQYMTIDTGSVQNIDGVATKGRANSDQWVTTYKVSYSTDNITYTNVDNDYLFSVKIDRNTLV
jgi:hypothetical protein